jgi:hypothetical protein
MLPVPVARTTPIPVETGTQWGTTSVQAAKTAEGAAATPSAPALAQVTPTLYKAVAVVHMTEELSTDTPAAYEALAAIIGRQLRGVAERWLLRGSGQGEPLGILNAPALLALAGSGAGTLTTTHLAAAAGRFLGGPGSFLVAGPSATGALRKIEMDGGRLPLPVLPTMEAPAVGTVGDATFVNPAGFAVHVKTGSLEPEATIYFALDQGLTSLRAWLRLGCVPLLSAPATPKLDTANTVSHAVTTATRS